MEDHIARLVVLGVICWTSLFLIVRTVFWKRSFDFCSRIVSIIHASLAVCLAIFSIDDWTCPVCPLASPSSPRQMQTLALSVAYFIYDMMICCLYDAKANLDNTIHHLVGIVGLGAGLAYQLCGSEMVVALCITEMSTPILHLREIVKELGYKGTGLNLAADVAFAAIFSLARMVIGPYLVYATLSAPNPFLIKAMALGLQLVSCFWFYKIVGMVKYKLAANSCSYSTPT